jgi:hypothetical protein
LDNLLSSIDVALTADPVDRVEVRIPQHEGKLLARIEARAKILKRSYEGDHVSLTIDAPESLLRLLKRYYHKAGSARMSSDDKGKGSGKGSGARLGGTQKRRGELNRPAPKKR